jgi:hypothetical protein
MSMMKLRTAWNIRTEKPIVSQTMNLSKQVDIISFEGDSKLNITCIKTKHLLHLVRTITCLHDNRDAVSNIVMKD